ncbi:MAG: hypothetical protein KGO02_03930 [Alphaproteobacteria bacterium]|nr:hypothetical protein [Alphaproteobacteria bacterium]
MITDLVSTFCIIVAAIVLYRFRAPIIDRLRRFDRENQIRIAQQERECDDPVAHFRHALAVAEDQVEPVAEIRVHDERLGIGVKRFQFLGEQYALRSEAERARADKIRAITQEYYRELPRALQAREDEKLGR